jgi:hypothetical protein
MSALIGVFANRGFSARHYLENAMPAYHSQLMLADGHCLIDRLARNTPVGKGYVSET